MNIAASHSYMKMSRTRGKSPGWAAFDVKQRQKQGLEPELDNEPYPPMTSTLSSLRPCKKIVRNNDLSARSFSSVLLPSVDFPTLAENRDCGKLIEVGDCSRKDGNKVVEENSSVLAFKKLKELHNWADSGLIEDIMAVVDDDVDKASTLLKEMVSAGSFDENKETHIKELNSTSDDFLWDNNTIKGDLGVPLGNVTDLAELRSALEDCLNENSKKMTNGYTSGGKKLSDDDAADMKLILGHLRSVPVEPEWEEDDVYLSHRKDAIGMMRSASQHSRAATNSFLRGDHLSAQEHSLKAREEWMAAERLNAKAAKEILSIRNSNNDVWKLDLHGLHAAEAIQALQEHLWKIETQVPSNRSVSPNKVKTRNGIVRSSSHESFSCMDMEKVDREQASSRQRAASLQVITGRGNHSRGQAALPTAVRSFLNENRYRFDEARPGVVTVWPKFRHR
ncbi:hypothetical protein L1049_020545 [Liquidambar formosana]|uniref:Smr domain-containing protein n=1 Tax=Liquidambar formosana TaxID=63359 RepID=A0AAP0X637_LIQFO